MSSLSAHLFGSFHTCRWWSNRQSWESFQSAFWGSICIKPSFDKISRSRGMLDVGTPLNNADCTRNVALTAFQSETILVGNFRGPSDFRWTSWHQSPLERYLLASVLYGGFNYTLTDVPSRSLSEPRRCCFHSLKLDLHRDEWINHYAPTCSQLALKEL